ncbi:MAG: GNAT family N-acetyltransferase [Alphaproteobacteria bacterium]|nr:GNAT family N-acetyltransferase [Alphaproteobacteria bacterium]
MNIITYLPEYAAQIVNLWRASKRHALGDYKEVHSTADMLHYLTAVMCLEEAVYLAINDDKLLGFMALKDNWINQLYIDINYLNQGIGSQFMQLAKQKSDGVLQLYCFERNEAACQFYQKHEFKATEFGTDNEEGLPDILYKWGD